MKPPIQNTPKQENLEFLIQDISRRIEDLKVQFNLYFSGELRIPPEKEREELEKRIRNMSSSSHRSSRINLLLQNISSRFSLYNNMWLKRLNEIESGVSILQKRKIAQMEDAAPKKPSKPQSKIVDVSLNDEDSFDRFFDSYSQSLPKKGAGSALDKEKIINSIKTKLITANLVDAKVNLTVEDGKLKIKIKGS
jgi:hypothetical protein